MATDIFEQLAETEVPPAPVDALDKGFNRRLNNRLLGNHLLDFALRCLPYTAWHMTRAMIAVVWYTISGKFINAKDDTLEHDEE